MGKLILVNVIAALIGGVFGFAFGRLHRGLIRQSRSGQPSAPPGYQALVAERERIQARQVCTDKSHWH